MRRFMAAHGDLRATDTDLERFPQRRTADDFDLHAWRQPEFTKTRQADTAGGHAVNKRSAAYGQLSQSGWAMHGCSQLRRYFNQR